MTTATHLAALLLATMALPAAAVREGSDNGGIIAERFEAKGEWAKAALWREAMATTLEYVSKPLAQQQIRRAKERGETPDVQSAQSDLKQIEQLIVSSRKRAAANEAKAKRGEKGVELEKQRVATFLDLWIPYYPRAMLCSWGYEKMRRKADRLTKRGDVKDACAVEEEHWRQCADWYEACCVGYYKSRDQKKAAHFTKVVLRLREKADLYGRKGCIRAELQKRPKILVA